MFALLALTLMTDHHLAGEATYYELRVYKVDDVAQRQPVLDYVNDALAPALAKNDALGPVGVFVEADTQPKDAQPTGSVYVLMSSKSLVDLVNIDAALLADETYRAAAQSFLDQPVKKAPYARIESKLMRAFDGMPETELPRETAAGADRVFEMRTYESHNTDKARLKVQMFNEGEIDVMKKVDLQPVFYGSTLVGGDAPNLVYMLSGPSLEAHSKNWKAFLSDPEWDAMKGLPEYAGTVSKISQVFLVPAKSSEI